MSDKPKYTIKNFNKNNIYMLRGMLPIEIAGNSILSAGYATYGVYDSSDIPDLGNFYSVTSYARMAIEGVDQSEWYMLALNAGDLYLLPKSAAGSYENYGKINDTNASGKDIAVTKNNTIITCDDTHMGLGYYLETDNVTQTSFDVVDPINGGSVDLGLLGVTSSGANDNVYNYEAGTAEAMGEEYDITSLSGGTSITAFSDYSGTVAGTVLVTATAHGLVTGDKASIRNTTNYNGDFTITKISTDSFYIIHTWVANDATGNVAPDEINFGTATKEISDGDRVTFFVNDKFNFGVSNAVDQQFIGQEVPGSWKRQIVLFGDDYFIGNGNYLASLNDDEETFSATAKQLPYKHQFQCMAVNNDKVLVGVEHLENDGKLLLWDSFTDGWLNELNICDRPVAIVPYNSSWIVFTNGGKLYVTDGYTKELITTIPGFESSDGRGSNVGSRGYNCMKIWDDKIFVSVYGSNQKIKGRTGIYIYDIKNDIWTFTIPTSEEYEYSSSSDVMAFTDGWTQHYLYYGSNDSLNRIYRRSGSPYSEAILKIILPIPQKVNQVELNLGFRDDYYAYISQINDTFDVSIAVGDGKKIPYIQTNAYNGTTTTIDPSDTYTGIAEVGNEVEILADDTNPEINSKQTFITSIADGGTNSEKWTISPALAKAPAEGSPIGLYTFKQCDSVRTVAYNTLNENLKFNVQDFYGDTLWIHIRIDGGRTDINSINIY